jgi:ABC-type polysaccharide/polyol phosphate export permease
MLELTRHRSLLAQLVRRDVLLRYRGAMFGVAWMFLSPLLMLAIFAFVFGSIFASRWPQGDSEVPFWLLLYAGLIIFNVFAETVSRAPASVRNYPSFIKKIIFPVEILNFIILRGAGRRDPGRDRGRSKRVPGSARRCGRVRRRDRRRGLLRRRSAPGGARTL